MCASSLLLSCLFLLPIQTRAAGCGTHSLSLHQQPEEYEKLGSYAMIGLPTELYKQRYVPGSNCQYREINGDIKVVGLVCSKSLCV